MASPSPSIFAGAAAPLARRFAHCEFHPELASTSSRALELGANRLPALIACEHQYAGRGRRSRTWLSPPGTALTFSVAAALAPGSPPAGLSLALAVAVAEGLAAAGYAARLKWPNDLIGPGGGKLGGILVELASASRVVVGLGLNLDLSRTGTQTPPPPPARARLLAGAECLASQPQAPAPARDALLARLAPALLAQLQRWPPADLAAILRRWRKLSVHRPGDPIEVTAAAGARRKLGYVGLDESGRLLARAPDGRTLSFASAEIADGPAGG